MTHLKKANPLVIKALLFFLLLANVPVQAQRPYPFDLQGHRGARGTMPENSLPAFQKALELGVTTLELDLAVSADGQLVVSHEPWFSGAICTDSAGSAIAHEQEQSFKIYAHTAAQIRRYDCGSKGNARFPEQEKIPTYKPLLSEVVRLAEGYDRQGLPPIRYNIEIKSTPESDGKLHPAPREFSDLLYRELNALGLPASRVTVQSFDLRVLQYWHQQYPDWPLAALFETGSFAENMKELGFKPAIYSPYYQLLSAKEVKKAQKKGSK